MESFEGFQVGQPDDRWNEKYGIQTYPLKYLKEVSPGEVLSTKMPTGTKWSAVTLRGKPIYVARSQYRVLPNEEAKIVADKAADLVGAVPIEQTDLFRGKSETYVQKQYQMRAIYVFPEKVQINGGDKLDYGFVVRNSIDGTMSFGVGGFTFRQICTNAVLFGYKGLGIERTLDTLYKRHTKSLIELMDEKLLKNEIILSAEATQELMRHYRQWNQIQLEEDMAKRIVKKLELPKRYIPAYINVDEKEPTRVQQLLNHPSVWEFYNNVTDPIWHNEDLGIEGKEHMYDKLHKVLIQEAKH